MKINKRYEHLIFTFLMALGMSGLISLIMLLVNNGFTGWFPLWLRSWLLAFIVAFPLAYFLPRGIRKLMSRIEFTNK